MMLICFLRAFPIRTVRGLGSYIRNESVRNLSKSVQCVAVANRECCASLWMDDGGDGEKMVVRWFGVLLVLAVGGCECRKPYSYQFVRRDFEQYYAEDEGERWMCLVFGLCAITPIFAQRPELRPVFEWSQLEFEYASPQERQNDIDSGVFVPGKPAPIDADVHYSYAPNKKNRVFVTIPRFQSGIPATLGIVTDKKLNNNPIIQPYPAWSWHRNPQQCGANRIVSVFRIMVDECQRLWVLDSGRNGDQQTCPPQILAFDLQTNNLIHKYEIPSKQYEPRSIFVTPVVDVRDAHGQCKDTFVYAADCQTYSIVVYDVQRKVSWRVTDKTMYPYPNYGTYNILGDSFDLMDGILGMALSPYKPGQDRVLFYHAMSSPTENWVKTSELRNQTRFLHDPTSSPQIFHTFKGERTTQSAAEAIDKDGIMYFGLMTDVTLDCWNTKVEYGPKTMDIVARNKQTMQFASGVKVVTNTKAAQELWVTTSRFQKVAAGTLKSTEVNFRIQAGRVEDIVTGTVCKTGRPATGNHGGTGGGYGLIKPTPGYSG